MIEINGNKLFTKMLNDIKTNNKDYYWNNLIDSMLITYIEDNDKIGTELKSDLLKILKEWIYTEWDNVYIFIFYNNLLNLISWNKKYIKFIKCNKKIDKQNEKKFRLIFDNFFWINTWRRKFEILKYWKEFSWKQNKINWFIKLLKHNKIIIEIKEEEVLLLLKLEK